MTEEQWEAMGENERIEWLSEQVKAVKDAINGLAPAGGLEISMITRILFCALDSLVRQVEPRHGYSVADGAAYFFAMRAAQLKGKVDRDGDWGTH